MNLFCSKFHIDSPTAAEMLRSVPHAFYPLPVCVQNVIHVFEANSLTMKKLICHGIMQINHSTFVIIMLYLHSVSDNFTPYGREVITSLMQV